MDASFPLRGSPRPGSFPTDTAATASSDGPQISLGNEIPHRAARRRLHHRETNEKKKIEDGDPHGCESLAYTDSEIR
jgi:hypothetical protein